MAELDQQIGELIAPLYPQIEPRISRPGVEATAAQAMLAEIGTGMTRFGSDARLASWAWGAQAITRVPASGVGAAPVQGIAMCGGCWDHVPGPRATRPRPSAVPSAVSKHG